MATITASQITRMWPRVGNIAGLGLRLAYTAAMVWLAASVMLSLLPKSTVAAGAGLSSAGNVFRGMFDGADPEQVQKFRDAGAAVEVAAASR